MKKIKNSVVLSLLLVFTLTMSSFELNSPLPTSLRITIIDELGNPVEGASVQLYATDEDYRAETNPVSEAQLTDKKGKTTFKKLESIIYFVNAEKGDKNNDGAGVQTDTLKTGLLNKVNIVIE